MFALKKKHLINIIFTLIISGIIIFIFTKNISLQEITQAFTAITFKDYIIFLSFMLFALLVRTYKYYLLTDKKIGLYPLTLITLVRNFSVDLLPARSAALTFYTYYGKKFGLNIASGTGSFIISALYDSSAIFLLLALIYPFAQIELNFQLALIILISLSIIILTMIFYANQISNLFIRLRFLDKYKIIREYKKDLKQYLEKKDTFYERFRLFFLSFILRLCKYLSLFMLFCAINASPINFNNFATLTFCLAFAELSSILPVQGFAGFGTWEMAFSFMFQFLNLSGKDPFITALVIHVVTQITEYSIGILAMIKLNFIQEKNTN